MREALCRGLVSQAWREEFVFLTGDLGFGALEPLRDAMGARFINAGVAEQNMVSVAAGLARDGLRSWAYSIAPFIYARPFEQIRNDVCLHDLPVTLVGNGGGYGYGVMGATHHALEDYGVLLTLNPMRVYVPAFAADVQPVIEHVFAGEHPVYLRLGRDEAPKATAIPAFRMWRQLVVGSEAVLIVVGPLAGAVWQQCERVPPAERPSLWCLSELPVGTLPEALISDVRSAKVVCVAEEHVAHGGAGAMLAEAMIAHDCLPKRLLRRTALGYPSGRYGSQAFHRRECGLDPASLLQLVSRGAAA